ncbi:MAG: glycoside hydrolase family 3 C-terminal domain-containing protein [Clostridia bacterium]|nr:glycoside hydrolase family 3 C-terminal domain-containing protein [Clostridia bacterium]
MNLSTQTETRIEKILEELSLEEKVAMCHANSKFNSGGAQRLGIDELSMMDGPHGVRSETKRYEWTCLNREEDKCTYLPPETTLAATFNPKLARLFGEILGGEARARGKDIVLGPGVNIIRNPLCGRNFEYMSEDPYLISKMAPELVKGIESQDVSSCVKHYALNNQELNRFHVNIEVGRRALHEIYLKGFYSAIIEGGASSVMGAFNKYEGQYCCHNNYLVNNVLKDKWGFKGVYLSDWSGTHDTDESIYNGLDIEMGGTQPYDEYYLANPFLEKAKESQEIRELLDEKVRRILRLMFSINKFSPQRKKGEYNTKKHQQGAYDVAAEGIVLLKNEKKLLPINKSKLKKLLVVGPNADMLHAQGGGSSGVRALYEISPLKALKDRLSGVCDLEYESGGLEVAYKTIPLQNLGIVDLAAGCRNYKVITYTKGENGNITEEENICDTPNISDGNAYAYKIIFTVEIPESGYYEFKASTDNSATVKFNDIECMKFKERYKNSPTTLSVDRNFKKDERIEVEVYIESPTCESTGKVNFTFGWITPSDFNNSSKKESLIEKAKQADYVIYCGGLNHSAETEGIDRKDMKLPFEQDLLITQLIKANNNTIVVITAGSAVEMPWIDEANSVIWSWYAGMEGGNALADILLGNISPSGKLPFTLPKAWEDTSVYRYGEYEPVNCHYNDDIFVGYRAFDKDNIEPLFPFGHGISYTEFDYSDLKIIKNDNGFEVIFKVTNIGNVKAKETVQVYVGDSVCSVKRPPKELQNFEKVELSAGESVEIRLPITKKDLSFFDESTEDWKFESGEFKVYVGSSSRDIRLTDSITL